MPKEPEEAEVSESPSVSGWRSHLVQAETCVYWRNVQMF